MSNSFSKEEKVAFDEMMVGFDDNLAVNKLVKKYVTDQAVMERSNYQIWRPQPYIANSYSGIDMTGNFDDYTQLSVPASIDTDRSVPWQMTALELNDALQEKRLGEAAMQKLASDINVACLSRASYEGTLFVKRTGPATGFDDLAAVKSIMNSQGVSANRRRIGLSSADYTAMAGELSKASRSFGNEISDAALRRAYVGQFAGIDTYELDYALRLPAAAASGITMDTRSTANNYYIPAATSTGGAGQTSNVDNRYQTIAVSSNTNIAVGDAFTIAGVEAAHHLTKLSTGQLKTFRVMGKSGSTSLVISPPIISNQGGTDAEKQNINVVLTSTASNAALVFLNTTAAAMNPFWCEDAIEILPGRDSTPTDAGAAVMRATTGNGIEVVMSKQFNIVTKKTLFRVDTRFGTVCLQPEMCGIVMFSQA